MPNGKPHDHPLTDIFIHGLETYGPETDEIIRKIRRLCSARELDEWWKSQIGWNCDREVVLEKASAKYAELLERAKNSGWETEIPDQ